MYKLATKQLSIHTYIDTTATYRQIKIQIIMYDHNMLQLVSHVNRQQIKM